MASVTSAVCGELPAAALSTLTSARKVPAVRPFKSTPMSCKPGPAAVFPLAGKTLSQGWFVVIWYERPEVPALETRKVWVAEFVPPSKPENSRLAGSKRIVGADPIVRATGTSRGLFAAFPVIRIVAEYCPAGSPATSAET